ncbi:hypothetical protein C0993_010651 [Termitomyces sp. T159_Od127]|nr:hypothetical protein C0993_010651 [Termitomyces sp. T159_Od127]
MRKKRAEWSSIARKELLKDGRQRLAEKCDALNAALMDQFYRLMKRQEEMTEGEMMQVVEEQSSQDTLVQVPPDGDWRPVDSQSASSLPPSSTSLFQTPAVEGLDFLTQPMSPESSDQQYTRISQTLYSSSRNLQTSSSSHPESLHSLIQPGSTESDEKEDQLSHYIEQGNSKGSTHTDLVEMDTVESSLMRFEEQRQERFLQSESERGRRFRSSEAARDAMEIKRSIVFNKRMRRWSKPESFHGREEERFGRKFRRSSAFQSFKGECFWVFSMSLSHFKEQAKAEADLEEVWFHHQKDVILALCNSQAIQLDRHITADQVVWFEYMRGNLTQQRYLFYPYVNTNGEFKLQPGRAKSSD